MQNLMEKLKASQTQMCNKLSSLVNKMRESENSANMNGLAYNADIIIHQIGEVVAEIENILILKENNETHT